MTHRATRAIRMRPILRFSACLILAAVLAGCILPYGYPTLGYTPRVHVGTEPSEVHAFRVEFTKHTADVSVHDPGRGTERLSRVPVASTAEVPAQIAPSATYGLLILGVALNYPTLTSHTVALRVYRPGFELVEIESWKRLQKIVWRPALDAVAQERALDELLPPAKLEKGCDAKDHKEALIFGASEYARLSGEAITEDDRNRLIAKASILRERTLAPKHDPLMSKSQSKSLARPVIDAADSDVFQIDDSKHGFRILPADNRDSGAFKPHPGIYSPVDGESPFILPHFIVEKTDDPSGPG